MQIDGYPYPALAGIWTKAQRQKAWDEAWPLPTSPVGYAGAGYDPQAALKAQQARVAAGGKRIVIT